MKAVKIISVIAIIFSFLSCAQIALADYCDCNGTRVEYTEMECIQSYLDNCDWIAESTSGTSGATAGGSTPLEDPLGKNGDVAAIARGMIEVVLGLVGVLALVAFVYGGVLWMTSYGETNKVTKGKNIMIWAVFGLAVIFASYAFLTVIFKAFGVGESTTSQSELQSEFDSVAEGGSILDAQRRINERLGQ